MALTQKEKNIYGKHAKILSQNNECTVFQIEEGDGDVIMTSYKVFEGINIIYNDIHTQYCSIENKNIGNILEINHCLEGRIECSFDNEFIFLEPGDMSISYKNDAGHDSFFPTKHYHGITISIDKDKAPESLSCFLDDVNIRPDALIKKFCSDNSCFVAPSKDYTEHIFSQLYSVGESMGIGYFKIKVLELLLFLSSADIDNSNIEKRRYTPNQVALAKKSCEYISTNLSQRITIDKLATNFNVSATQLKNCFKGVYGESVYAYIRCEKMYAAAHILKTTDCNILDIANQFGYDNGSKFASAFNKVMGMTPREYRNQI